MHYTSSQWTIADTVPRIEIGAAATVNVVVRTESNKARLCVTRVR